MAPSSGPGVVRGRVAWSGHCQQVEVGLAACRPGPVWSPGPLPPFLGGESTFPTPQEGEKVAVPVSQRPPRGKGLRGTEAWVRVPSSPKEKDRGKERKTGPLSTLHAGPLALFEMSNVPPSVLRQMPPG